MTSMHGSADKSGAGVGSRLRHGQDNPVLQAVAEWRQNHDAGFGVESSEFGYPVVDLRSVPAEVALDLLKTIDERVKPAYHGMHNNEFRRAAGMSGVQVWAELDPAKKSQDPKHPLVYATTSLRGGLVHAVLEHRLADQHPVTGETYSLIYNPRGDGAFMEVSPHLAQALASGEDRFTDGLLYILPKEAFAPSHGSSHELATPNTVAPLAVVQVSKTLGPRIVTPQSLFVRCD